MSLIPVLTDFGPFSAVLYDISQKNIFTKDKSYGAVYWDPAKPGFKPVITVSYDESKPKLIRALLKTEVSGGLRADGTEKKVTINFTAIWPTDVDDTLVEDAILLSNLLQQVANFRTSFVDRVA